jgi:hypothetical protein
MTITVTYLADFSMGSNLETQLALMDFHPLNTGELTFMPLEISSDSTTWDSNLHKLKRVVTFTETPEYLKRLGLPLTDEKRMASIRGLFRGKIGARIGAPIEERIELHPT